jgi:hypothetical protein
LLLLACEAFTPNIPIMIEADLFEALSRGGITTYLSSGTEDTWFWRAEGVRSGKGTYLGCWQRWLRLPVSAVTGSFFFSLTSNLFNYNCPTRFTGLAGGFRRWISLILPRAIALRVKQGVCQRQRSADLEQGPSVHCGDTGKRATSASCSRTPSSLLPPNAGTGPKEHFFTRNSWGFASIRNCDLC